jgi:hypothetical protein
MNNKCTNNTCGDAPELSQQKLHRQNLKQAMTTKPRSLIKLLLLSTLMLAWAGSAIAATIVVDSVTVSLASITPPPTAADTIQVIRGGTLFVDTNGYTIGYLIIGDANTVGNAVFNSVTPQTLTVAHDVTFGPQPGNFLDMTLSTANTLQVGGGFLANPGGAGTFRAGAATIEYYSFSPQTVTAYIGGNNLLPIQYKNLVLSGTNYAGNPSVPTGIATKTFAPGVSVQGTLTIKGQAVPSGPSLNWGPLAALAYSSTYVSQTATLTEWPAAPYVGVPVSINNPIGVYLTSDKVIGAPSASPNSLSVGSATMPSAYLNLQDQSGNPFNLTVQGNVVNGLIGSSFIQGTGTLILGGSGSQQLLAGDGSYGNLMLNNNAALPSSIYFANIPQPIINGRLTISSGFKLTIPSTPNDIPFQASLLSYPYNSDRAAGTYGSTSSSATITDNTVFDSNASGKLQVLAKQAASVSQNLIDPATGKPISPWAITYGNGPYTVSGKVTPSGSPNLNAYGDGPVPNVDQVSNVLYTSSVISIKTNVVFVTDASGSYSTSFDTTKLPVGTYSVESTFLGGINLTSNFPPASTPLIVNPRLVTVIPDGPPYIPANQSKIYGQADPILTFHLASGPNTYGLVNGDAFTGALDRAPGETVVNSPYQIVQGTLVLSANYTLIFSSTPVYFAITKKNIYVTMINASKVYGYPDGCFCRSNVDYTISSQLSFSDQIAGALARANPTVNDVGTYPLSVGTLGAAGAAAGNYTFQVAPGNSANLTITPLPITVTFASVSKYYNNLDPISQVKPPVSGYSFNWNVTPLPPPLTLPTLPSTCGTPPGTIANLPYCDQWTSLFSTNRVAGEPVVLPSPYIILPQPVTGPVVGAGNVAIQPTKAGNYTVTYSTVGTLTINAPHVIMSPITPPVFTYPSISYGDATPTTNTLVSYQIEPNQGTYSGYYMDGHAYPAPQNQAHLIWLNGQVIQCTVPNPGSYYGYNINANYLTLDPNYIFDNPGSLALGGELFVNKATDTITAQNQVQVEGQTFPYASFSVNDVGRVCGDTFSAGSKSTDAFTSGQVNYGGDAKTATAAGVYQISLNTPPNSSTLASAKYNIVYNPGWLTITPKNGPGTTTIGTTANPVSANWYGTSMAAGDPTKATNLTWFANQANGTVGTSSGWSLLLVNGTLTINAIPGDPFRLDLVTLMANNLAGKMAKFDPTRPYTWEVVRTTGGISPSGGGTFNPNSILINAFGLPGQGANLLFENQTFNGVFSVSLSADNKSLYLNFTPMGSTGGLATGAPPRSYQVSVPAGYEVGTNFTQTQYMLGSIWNSDVPMIWLQPTATNLNPQDTVTIKLNVANLQGQHIIGADAYINFDSRFFDATTGPNGPVVAAGGGVWNNLIYRTWNTIGDLDTVIAVFLNNQTGTSDDGTMATIKLTPTKTATGTSRVVFRHDGDQKADGTGPLTNDLVTVGNAQLLPARVMTDEITINYNSGPIIRSITAYQLQPIPYGQVFVKNGPGQVVRMTDTTLVTPPTTTSATASGPVVITIGADDGQGVGLSGPPTLTMTKTGSSAQQVPCTTPNATVGPFVYYWDVDSSVADGTWTATVVASDTISPAFGGPNTTTTAFTLLVNKAEVNGVVELENFGGTNRTVTFKSGGTTGLSMSNQWDLNLNFISGPILNAGAYQNAAALADKIDQPVDSVSVWLRNGSILNLTTLVSKLLNPGTGWGVSTYIYTNEFGSITSLPILANALAHPTRNIDVYLVGSVNVQGRLSSSTMTALAAYENNPSPYNASVLNRGLLYDFNSIVLGANIWEAVRFAGVPQSCNPTGTDTVAINRCLLESAYSLAFGGYVAGNLNPQTAQQLSVYNPSVGNSDLATNILADFATLSYTPALWPPHPNPPPPAGTGFDQGLYNQTMFLGIPLSTDTTGLLQAASTDPNTLALLNQYLLQDAYAGLYQKPPLSPATLAYAADPNNIQAFVTNMTHDLNLLINGGVSIYYMNLNAWASFTDAITWNIELHNLLYSPHPLPAPQQVRENRLLLETAYNVELSKSVLSNFRLVQVPNPAIGTQLAPTQLSAKTAWNLRVTKSGSAVVFTGGLATINFVNDGVPGWSATGTDFYLRGGDIDSNHDNVINLFDYNILRQYWPGQPGNQSPLRAQADIDGDGTIGYGDYYQLQHNWGTTGDPEVKN